MPEKPWNKDRGVTITECEVIYKESKGNLIVRNSDGTTANIVTKLPDVGKGHKGRIIEMNGRKVFIREPYDD
jgi:hypothetical protein